MSEMPYTREGHGNTVFIRCGANIMEKLNANTVADLLKIALGAQAART